MNKAELIDSIGQRLGDRKAATAALDAVLSEIQSAVTKGDKVSIVGFGVFERRERAARTARNPRTGEPVKVKKTAVPAFRPGAGFRELVAVGRVPRPTKSAVPSSRTAPPKKGVATAARTAPAKTAPAKRKTTATKAAPMGKATATPRRPATTAAAATRRRAR
jgi:DNA-binding protein HU-beta